MNALVLVLNGGIKMTSIPRDSLCFRLNDLLAVEKHYDAKYLIDCEYNGDDMCCLFYTDKKHPEGSNFFILHFRGVDMLISNGLSYAQKLRIGVLNSKNEIIHSRCRHDFRKVGAQVHKYPLCSLFRVVEHYNKEEE